MKRRLLLVVVCLSIAVPSFACDEIFAKKADLLSLLSGDDDNRLHTRVQAEKIEDDEGRAFLEPEPEHNCWAAQPHMRFALAILFFLTQIKRL